MKILFLSDSNGHDYYNPYAVLIELPNNVTSQTLSDLEARQLGAYRRGGSWKEIMEDGKIVYNVISEGRKSDYKDTEYDNIYKLISGNY